MRKIYSLVLMVTALLIGTTTWAKEYSSLTTAAQLQDAIDAILSGEETDPEIKLTAAASQLTFDDDAVIWVGQTAYPTDAQIQNRKCITLDLNGHTIYQVSNTNNHLFVLTFGELIIKNTNSTEAVIKIGGGSSSSAMIDVFGSYRSSRWNAAGTALADGGGINTRTNGWFSHLEIGENVKLIVEGKGMAIQMDTHSNSLNGISTLGYKTWLKINSAGVSQYSQYGFAYGLRVDIKGKIEVNNPTAQSGGGDGKAYGIKVNGYIQSPISADFNSSSYTKLVEGGADIDYLTNYNTGNRNSLDTANNKVTHRLDTIDVPFIMIHPNAEILTSANGDKSTPIYASGYAKWLIQGQKIEGKSGVYVTSGIVEIDGAKIKSTASGYSEPTDDGSANGGGSGLVINSRIGGYSGDMDITISGNTEIKGCDEGYGIEEVVNTTNHNTEVDHLVVTGGSISGGGKVDPEDPTKTLGGAIVISEPTIEQGKQTGTTPVVVYDANVNGDVQAGTTGDLQSLLPTGAGDAGAYITEVVVDGKTTYVVTSGATAAPEEAEAGFDIDDFNAGDLNLSALTTAADRHQVFDSDTKDKLEIGTLMINTPSDSIIVTIKSGHTIVAQKVVMGEKAQIVVEPNASLIIYGTTGINTVKTSNIILKADETGQATFLFNPAVTTNGEPFAIVDMRVSHVGVQEVNAVKYREWHRFALPLSEALSYDKNPNVGTYIYYWNYNTPGWEQVPAGLSNLHAFEGYTLSPATTYQNEITYTFGGKLVGNADKTLNFAQNGFNYFGNSYTANMDILSLVNQLTDENTGLEATLWTWIGNGYTAIPMNALHDNPGDFNANLKQIKPMQTFILRMTGSQNAETVLSYKSSVWDNPTYDAVLGRQSNNSAPARLANDNTFMRISINAGEKSADNVIFMEENNFSDAIENGYDASKFMNTNNVNMYATVNGENFSAIATDNLEGKTLSLSTNNEAIYTLSFSNVRGAEYAIRDNVTNAVIAIVDGASYEFAAQPNSVIENRFEIVNVNKMPTAIENTEVKANVKGIYTITGQFVGENFDVLPAGVYVVDGVKIVK